MKYKIEFDADEIKTASEWHSGQYSMLYAIASTGNLALGSVRPAGCDSDSEHFETLKDSLRWEIEDCLDIALDSPDPDEGAIEAFESMLAKLGIEK